MLKKLFGLGKPSALIAAAFRDITGMLQQAGRMLDHSLAVLLDNRELEVDLEGMDDVIDEAEQMVRRSILEHMTVSPRQDLVASLILASIVQEAERIGDFARGLAEIARLAAAKGAEPETLVGLSGLGDLTLTCNAMQSRNFSLGVALGSGSSLE